MTDPNRMFVVCTDRGQHDEERLTWVRWHEEDHWSMPIGAGRSSVGYMWPSPDAERTLPGTRATGTPRSSYAFYCPVCDRHPQVHQETWRQIVREFRRLGASRLDISQLPC